MGWTACFPGAARASFCTLLLPAILGAGLFLTLPPAAFGAENSTISPPAAAERTHAEEQAVAAQKHTLAMSIPRKELTEAFYKHNPHLPTAVYSSIPDIDVYDGVGVTRLHKAVVAGNELLVSALLKRGANPNVRSSWGQISLHTAVERESLEIVRLLLEAGADPRLDGVFSLAGSAAVQQLLHKYGTDPEQKLVFRPMLMLPPDYCYTEDTDFLTAKVKDVERGVLPDTLATAVIIGCSPGELRNVLATMKARGDTINTADKKYRTALFQAVATGASPAVFAFLLENGADPMLYPVPGHNTSLLHDVLTLDVMTITERIAVTRLLLKAGAEINYVDDAGRTPLLAALSVDRDSEIADLIQLLLTLGANPKIQSKDGRDALDYARRRFDADALIPLLSAKNTSPPSDDMISSAY